MNLYTKLQARATQGKPLRIGLIGTGKFGAMYCAQVPKTPGVHIGLEVGISVASAGVRHEPTGCPTGFQADAVATAKVTTVLMSGFFERHPKINAAVFEASSTWRSFLLDECDKAYRLYRNERQLPPLKCLPSETFFQHCVTSFEGDEAPPARFPEFYRDILAWSSDVYHHDGDDAWRAIETMQQCGLPVADQAKFLGANARRLYHITPPTTIIRERVCEIQRPDWWPTEEEVRAALKPEAFVTHR